MFQDLNCYYLLEIVFIYLIIIPSQQNNKQNWMIIFPLEDFFSFSFKILVFEVKLDIAGKARFYFLG